MEETSDGCETTVYPFLADGGTVHGTVVILHGLAEHHNRYREFTLFLNSCGYDVYLYDHRGHGTSYGKRLILYLIRWEELF